MDLDQLARALRVFAAQDLALPLHHCQLFLVVAEQGPCTYRDLERELSLSNSSVSRTCTALSETHRSGRPGLNLLELYQDPEEGRRFRVRLSKQGRNVVRQLQDL